MSDHGHPRVPETDPHGSVDVPTGIRTTGHEWDGIKELNTPMPRWWLWVFYATHVWALAYVVLYPAIPLLNDATTGLLGWHSRAELAEEIGTAELSRAEIYARIRDLPLEEIVADETLRTAAFRGGQSAFKVNCVQCHGADAAGSPGFANLNDDDWIWGGTLDEIHHTIAHGVRFAADEETRTSEMPAFGRDGILGQTEIAAVTQHVLSLSGAGPANPDGAAIYAQNCAACHGENGEGSHEIGAPQLDDAVWLMGSDLQTVYAQISAPRHGVMPAWGQRLDPALIKQLAVYVHGLGGGESVAPQAAASTP